MPLFTKWRAAFGEARTLVEAPGQLVQERDDNDGLSALIVAGLFLWDCWVYSERGIILEVSHDERWSVYKPRDLDVPNLSSALENVGAVD